MTEYVHRMPKPDIIGHFNSEEAQNLARVIRPRTQTYFPLRGLSPEQLDALAIEVSDPERTDRNAFVSSLSAYAENLSNVLDPDGGGVGNVNKWHVDVHQSTIPGEAPFSIVPVTIGSSSHSTEIVYGDIVFKHDINRSRNYKNYLLAEAGQRAVDLALSRGDAGIYEPEDGVLDGKIVQFAGPNIHRRRQSIPVDPFRLVLRQH